MMTARFTSPCPFCQRAVARGNKLMLSSTKEWMHPKCAQWSDAGKTWAEMQLAYQIGQRARELKRLQDEQEKALLDHSEEYL